MRKALIPMLASLALCGAGTLALIASNARGAQASSRKPVMVSLVAADALLAQNLPDASPASDASAPSFVFTLKQFCDDQYASEVGRMAYLQTRLALTDGQEPLFAHWRETRLDIAKHRAADCQARTSDPNQDRADPLARMSREEAILKQRIADLDAERPVFATLYAVLTPEQRQALAPQHPMLAQGPMAPPAGAMMGNPP